MMPYNKKIQVNCKEKSEDYKTKHNNFISIYHNFKEYSIDKLQYREYVNEHKIYYNTPSSRKCKSMHITLDYHDNAKHLKTMDLKTLPKRITKEYYIKYDDKVFTISKFKKYCKIRKIRLKEDYRNNCFITSKYEIVKYYHTTRNNMLNK